VRNGSCQVGARSVRNGRCHVDATSVRNGSCQVCAVLHLKEAFVGWLVGWSVCWLVVGLAGWVRWMVGLVGQLTPPPVDVCRCYGNDVVALTHHTQPTYRTCMDFWRVSVKRTSPRCCVFLRCLAMFGASPVNQLTRVAHILELHHRFYGTGLARLHHRFCGTRLARLHHRFCVEL